MDSFDDIWQAVLDYIKTRINGTAYNLWIKIVTFDGFSNSTVTLRLPKPMHVDIVTSQYGSLFEEAFENVLGFKVNINYVCDDVLRMTRTVITPPIRHSIWRITAIHNLPLKILLWDQATDLPMPPPRQLPPTRAQGFLRAQISVITIRCLFTVIPAWVKLIYSMQSVTRLKRIFPI